MTESQEERKETLLTAAPKLSLFNFFLKAHVGWKTALRNISIPSPTELYSQRQSGRKSHYALAARAWKSAHEQLSWCSPEIISFQTPDAASGQALGSGGRKPQNLTSVSVPRFSCRRESTFLASGRAYIHLRAPRDIK